MTMNFEFDVFLSYNAWDGELVQDLADRLIDAGLRVWMDRSEVHAGESWTILSNEALVQSRVLVLCLSPNTFASGWVDMERNTTLHRGLSNDGRRFVPLLLSDCELPESLRRYTYVDYRERSDSAFNELLTQIGLSGFAGMVALEFSDKRRSLAFAEMAILAGHESHLHAISWSPNGRFIATCSLDKTVQVWEWNDSKATHLKTLSNWKNQIWQVCWSPDSTKIIITINEQSPELWDITNFKRLFIFHESPKANACAWSPDDRTIGIGTKGSTVDFYDSKKYNYLRSFEGDNRDTIKKIAWSPDGSLIAVNDSSTINIVNTYSFSLVAKLTGHSSKVLDVIWANKGEWLISGSDDHTIRIWDVKTKTLLQVLEGHTNGISGLSLSADQKLLASYAEGETRLWRMNSWESVGSLEQESDGEGCLMTRLSFHPEESILAIPSKGMKHQVKLLQIFPDALLTRTPEITRRYINAKVVLLGEGKVGKTTLAHRLIKDEYALFDRTHGMNVWRLDLPLEPDETLEREALLWDLAGQEDYRLVHQLFLEETALAILLINPQLDDPMAEAGDWMKALKVAATQSQAARDAGKILVFSQVDAGGMKLSNNKIDSFCEHYGFTAWLPTSAKTGENCSDSGNESNPSKLKQLIARCVPWDRLPSTSTPRLLAELKNAVLTMRNERDTLLLRFAELAQRLELVLPGEKFGESDVRTAVTLLANHGLVQPLKFGDLILLKPEILNGYASAIIRAARLHSDEIGSVSEQEVYSTGFDFTGVDRLPYRPDEELLLRALVQTFLDRSLCIAEETPRGRQLVFPSQYRREKDSPRNPNIFVSYTFSGEWQTIWTTLIVRLWYSQEFEHRELWRNAAEFASVKGHKLGLRIENKQGEGRATISLYFDVEVEDVLKAIFIEYVHRHLAKFGCEVSRDRRYVCTNCGKSIDDLDTVRERLKNGKDFIICQKCDRKVQLIDYIETRLKSDPVAQKIFKMDEVATRQLDTQALEQILIGHMMAICGEANQIFRPVTMFDHGIDGEVEFKDNNGKASARKIYVQLKSGNSYLRTRKTDGCEIFDVKERRHLQYWIDQPVDVYLVIRQIDPMTNIQMIRWMNVSQYLRDRSDKDSLQIDFRGEKLDMEAIYRVRDRLFSSGPARELFS